MYQSNRSINVPPSPPPPLPRRTPGIWQVHMFWEREFDLWLILGWDIRHHMGVVGEDLKKLPRNHGEARKALRDNTVLCWVVDRNNRPWKSL